MLDPRHRFILPDVPGVVVFPDLTERTGFYAMPAAPRVARDADGVPEASLVLYGKGKGTSFRVTGCILTLTTSLELTLDEARRVRAALGRRVQGEAGGRGRPPVSEATLLSVDAIAGDVEVLLTPQVTLRGSPSLTSANRCSFNQKLDAEQARSLLPEWKQGLRTARATYRLQLRAGPTSIRVEVHDTTRRDRTPSGIHASTAMDASVSAQFQEAVTLTVEGILGGTAELSGRATTVEL